MLLLPHDLGTSAECVTADDTLHVQGLGRMPGREVGALGLGVEPAPLPRPSVSHLSPTVAHRR